MAPVLCSKASVPAATKLRSARVSQPPQQLLSAKTALAGITATAASLLLAVPDASAFVQLSAPATPHVSIVRSSLVLADLPDGLQTITTAPEPTPADPRPSTQRPIDIPTNTELLKSVADPVPSPGKGPLNKLAKREAKTEGANAKESSGCGCSENCNCDSSCNCGMSGMNNKSTASLKPAFTVALLPDGVQSRGDKDLLRFREVREEARAAGVASDAERKDLKESARQQGGNDALDNLKAQDGRGKGNREDFKGGKDQGEAFRGAVRSFQ